MKLLNTYLTWNTFLIEIARGGGGGALVLGNNLVLESNFNKNYGHQTFV